MDFFRSEEEPLLWVELELLSFCLDLDLPDLESDLVESDLLLDLLLEDTEVWVSQESSLYIPSIVHQ